METSVTHIEIPVNSGILEEDNTTSRFKGAEWFNEVQKYNITLAGLGGIGSWTGLLLARLKPNSITLYDGDTVEDYNMSGQLYSKRHVNRNKCDVISEILPEYANYYRFNGYTRFYDTDCYTTDIMICGFDNMGARKTFFEKWLSHIENKTQEESRSCLFIDGRLNSEEFQIFCIRGDDSYSIQKYKSDYLFTDEEAEPTICSNKQTSHCAAMIASFIVNLFVNFVTNNANPTIERDLPFMTSYNAVTMYLKTIA